jgi:hypothetical protein
MAHGNRGHGLVPYGCALYDDHQKAAFLRSAYADLRVALTQETTPEARGVFQTDVAILEKRVPAEILSGGTEWRAFPMGESEAEVGYRRWCLSERLFLNPLNDIVAESVSAHDILSAPNIVVALGEGPHYHGYFSQLKQEFVSARYLFYDGTRSTEPHFSDREVLVYNTLDYPVYGLASEKVRSAFRSAYSILDKVAFFLNHYLRLSIPERNVKFRTLWYEGQNRERPIRTEFGTRGNWPLRGLFWLSKDLFEDSEGFRDALEDDAKELASIRNHLEHKYLKLVDIPVTSAKSDTASWFEGFADGMAVSVNRRRFQEKTLRLLKMARAAMIYLSLGVHAEEKERAKKRKPGAIVPPMQLDEYDDEWKR